MNNRRATAEATAIPRGTASSPAIHSRGAGRPFAAGRAVGSAGNAGAAPLPGGGVLMADICKVRSRHAEGGKPRAERRGIRLEVMRP
jgi:hypothetical protein